MLKFCNMQNRGIFVEKREGKDPWTDKGVPGDWITELKIGDLGATRSLEEDEVLIKVKVRPLRMIVFF